jgi:hypothetical protein
MEINKIRKVGFYGFFRKWFYIKIDSNSFETLEQLRELYLNDNYFENVCLKLFNSQFKICNKIDQNLKHKFQLPENVFKGIEGLRVLELHGNNFKKVR